MIVAIIPARGGSKRIPKKNIRHFSGRPMISYSIEAARETGLFQRILVSTDSEEIAQVASEWGAEIPFIRPAELADDFVGTDAVVGHTLRWLKENGCSVKTICCIYATAPFVRSEDIHRGYYLLKKYYATSAFSVATFSYPIFRALKTNKAQRLEMFWPEYLNSRSQDLPEAYHDAGQFCWADAERYLEQQHFFSDDAVPVLLPRYFVQDIDTPEDWEMAELMYKAMQIQEGK